MERETWDEVSHASRRDRHERRSSPSNTKRSCRYGSIATNAKREERNQEEWRKKEKESSSSFCVITAAEGGGGGGGLEEGTGWLRFHRQFSGYRVGGLILTSAQLPRPSHNTTSQMKTLQHLAPFPYGRSRYQELGVVEVVWRLPLLSASSTPQRLLILFP